MKMKKVVLAYSGGLDTSYCLKIFKKRKGYEVHTVPPILVVLMTKN
jgi:argininosuccinate synthase